MTLILAILTLAAVIWCGSTPSHRPPMMGLAAAMPVAALALIPFLAVGHAGILGVSLNNDMAPHMLISEGYLAGAIGTVAPPDYPLGPHAMVALIAEGLNVGVDRAFAGWTMALPLLSAWTALTLLPRRASWLGQVLAATVVGMPFLIAAYYGEGAFKEVLQAVLVLATAAFFSGYRPAVGRGRWVALALIVGGILSVYSVAGLPWPAVFAVAWLLVIVTRHVRRAGMAGWRRPILGEVPALAIASGVLIVSIFPQLPRIVRFASSGQSAVIAKNNLGNLAGPLPGWEAFGVWNNPDFRLPASPAFTGGMWVAFVLALAICGVLWLVRRGHWMLPLAAIGSMLIWAASVRYQSPYVAAKALVIASPLLLAVAIVPLVAEIPSRPLASLSAAFRRASGQAVAWGAAGLLLALLFFKVGLSDIQVLRASPVGPTDHAEELRTLRPLLDHQRTLFLGNDDFIQWELAGVPVHAPVIGFPELPMRPQKEWSYGKAHDFDSVDAPTLNSFRWVITTRDAAGSAPPAGLRLVQTTRDFALWKRVQKVKERSILSEGEMPGAVLDCQSAAGRRALRGGGVAAVRPRPVVAPVGDGLSIGPGGQAAVNLPLRPGTWQLEASYVSRLPIMVTAAGLATTVPPSLDRPGPRWPIGQLRATASGPFVVTFHVADPLLASPSAIATLTSVTATRRGPERVVPIRRACGRYVDWYQGADGTSQTSH